MDAPQCKDLGLCVPVEPPPPKLLDDQILISPGAWIGYPITCHIAAVQCYASYPTRRDNPTALDWRARVPVRFRKLFDRCCVVSFIPIWLPHYLQDVKRNAPTIFKLISPM